MFFEILLIALETDDIIRFLFNNFLDDFRLCCNGVNRDDRIRNID